MKKYRVLITYVEAGMGHIVSAEAIANALERFYPDEVEVIRCNIFTETNDKELINYEKFLVDTVKKSSENNNVFYSAFRWAEVLPPGASLRLAHNTIYNSLSKKVTKIIESYNPDMVISTHFTPLHISIKAKNKLPNMIAAAYDPDPNCHSWWDNRADLFMINNEKLYNELIEKFKFKAENIVVGKFISRKEVLEASTDKKEMRKKHNLPLDNFTVIMADGAYAKANLKKFAEEFLTIDKKFTLIIIAGKNDEMYEYFKNKIGANPNIDLRVYKFVNNVYELYCASDIFVTKTGPNALLDSVQVETPILGNYYAGPIEEITKDLYINDNEVGIYTEDEKIAKGLIEDFIDNPKLLFPYIANCKKFKENFVGGEKIFADKIVEKLRQKDNEK